MPKLPLFFAAFLLLFIGIIGKLAYIQLFSSDTVSNNIYLKTERISPSRGLIFDRHGDPLAMNKTVYKLFAEPKNMTNKHAALTKLDRVLHMGSATLEAKLFNDKQWVPVTSGLDLKTRRKVEKLNIKGLVFEEEEKRFYPEASVAAHLLGFVGKDDKANDVGYFGIEGYFNKDLGGLPGLVKSERDVFGKPIFIGVQDVVRGENGRDLTLTIDKTVQMIVKKHLKIAIEKFQAESGCVVIIDPYSGEVIAMSCLPDFDPDTYGKFPANLYENPAVSIPFEPGSIFKPLIMAVALEEKVVKPTTKINETGRITIGSYQIANWDDKYKGVLTMTDVIKYSSNIGMVKVASKMKKETIQKYLQAYGFGERSGIDLQGEAYGLVKNTKSWYPIDQATIAFGQGIAVTPIQMIRAFASLVNGGWMVRPYTVLAMKSDSGTTLVKPERVRRVISEKTSRQIRQMLAAAVEHGEVKWKIPKGYQFGGKTGTAQIPIEGHYDPTKTIASFVGFVPLNKPRFIALVTLRKPATSQWGSETAAPVFFDIARELLVYYSIPQEQ